MRRAGSLYLNRLSRTALEASQSVTASPTMFRQYTTTVRHRPGHTASRGARMSASNIQFTVRRSMVWAKVQAQSPQVIELREWKLRLPSSLMTGCIAMRCVT